VAPDAGFAQSQRCSSLCGENMEVASANCRSIRARTRSAWGIWARNLLWIIIPEEDAIFAAPRPAMCGALDGILSATRISTRHRVSVEIRRYNLPAQLEFEFYDHGVR
jgi:hypothetical protein